MKLTNLKSKKSVLVKNTVMLYILSFSGYFFSFITVPYQTRILGIVYYGKLGFALAFMVYFQLIMDFGFILSATEDVSENRDNKEELSRIMVSVSIVKAVLIILSFIMLTALCIYIPKLRAESLLYILCFLAVAVNSLLPDYLYRGLEHMTIITIRTVIVKLFFTVMVFLLLKNKEDYYWIPVLNLLGNIGAVIGVYVHAFTTLGIKPIHVRPMYIWKTFKRSSSFFYSRIASSVYGATNIFILGFIYSSGSNIIGLYTSADKLIGTAKSGFSPIADSLYPYMVKNRDFRLIKKVILILMPPVIIGSILVGIFAESFCAFLLGEEFRSAGTILRLLMPIVVMAPLTYILGFPVLSPMGLAKYCNLSVIFASCIHLFSLALLFITGKFSVISLCYITSLTELILLAFRVAIVYWNRNLMRSGGVV